MWSGRSHGPPKRYCGGLRSPEESGLPTVDASADQEGARHQDPPAPGCRARARTLASRGMDRDVRFARNGDVHIAYQVVGDGPIDLVHTTGIFSNLDVMWEEPRWARYLGRLASFSRLILFDMRGVGLSDRGPEPPLVELQMDDVRAVMDAAGSESAAVFGGARGSAA